MLQFALLVVSASAIREIKVYSYSGPGAGMADVDNQHKCFNKDLVPGWQFRGTKHSGRITAEALKGYDVLLMPGGSPGSELSHTDRDAVRNFVKNGGGYYGTCAGAMAGCSTYGADPITGQIDPSNASVKVASVGTDENGMPIYPDSAGLGLSSAVCGGFFGVGATQNELTSAGKSAFPNQPSVVTIDHHNGPAMEPNSATVLATFKGGPRNGKASIVGDTYGKGKVVLISPHPEHPDGTSGVMQNCDIINYIALYAAGGSPKPTHEQEWTDFKKNFAKEYNSVDEEEARFAIFTANLDYIEATNAKNLTYTLGVNQFADLTVEEFLAEYTGAKKPLGLYGAATYLGEHDAASTLPDSVDWTTKGAVTSVKDQHKPVYCGSCWAYSAAGALEGAYAIASGQQAVSVSAQQFVDCTKDGCSGGWPYDVFRYLESKALCTEASYPYTAKEGSCKESGCTAAIPRGGVTGYKSVSKSQSSLSSAVVQQPVSITVAAGGSMQHYKSGVITDGCPGQINHAVLAVGYGAENGKNYWKVKNSWGDYWGDKGFFKLERGQGGQGALCVLQESPTYPVVSKSASVVV